MNRQDAVLSMPFAKLYALLVQKAIKKGRTRAEVGTVTGWLTGYTPEELKNAEESGLSYGDFFRQAPCLNPAGRKSVVRSVGNGSKPSPTPYGMPYGAWISSSTAWPKGNRLQNCCPVFPDRLFDQREVARL